MIHQVSWIIAIVNAYGIQQKVTNLVREHIAFEFNITNPDSWQEYPTGR